MTSATTFSQQIFSPTLAVGQANTALAPDTAAVVEATGPQTAGGDAALAAVPGNLPPEPKADRGLVTPGDRPLSIPASDLLANDRDADGDTLTITAVRPVQGSSGSVGEPSVRLEGSTVVFNPSNRIPWASIKGNRIEQSFAYEVSDGRGGIGEGVVPVAVTRPDSVSDETGNLAPIANQDSGFRVNEGETLRVSTTRLLANDRDPDTDVITLTSVRLANPGAPGMTDGAAVRIENGNVVYDPGSQIPWPLVRGNSFQDTVLYEITDARGRTATGVMTVSIPRPAGPPLRPDALKGPPGERIAGSSSGDKLVGTARNDRIEGRQGNDDVFGGPGDDDFVGGEGNDTLVGGAGFDSGFYAGSVLDYVIQRRGRGSARVRDTRASRDGEDDLTDVEQIAFHDRTVYLEGTNNSVLSRPDEGFTVKHGQALRIPAARLLANDIDFDGDPLQLTKVKDARIEGNDVVYAAPSGPIQWPLASSSNGILHTFSYEVTDKRGSVETQTVTVRILPSDNPADPNLIFMPEDKPQTGNAGNTTIPSSAADSLWTNTITPATVTWNDAKAAELGVKFQASTGGLITGIRFYKGPQNTGTHTGNLWTSTGQNLGAVTFTNETASGWQTATFAQPIQIAAGTTYVASYFAPRGFYSLDEGFFNSTGVTSGLLTAPSSGSVGGNGVYAYGTSSRYPGFTFRGSNYWVDVVFEPQTGGNSVPVAGSDSASTNNVSDGRGGMAPASITVPVAGQDDGTANKIVRENVELGNPQDGTNTTTPALVTENDAKAVELGVTDVSGGTASANAVAAAATSYSLWTNTTTPTLVTENDAKAAELGVKFQASTGGLITGIRFYKGPQNTGTHTGNLWTSTGQNLGAVTFTNETASGWQTATFAQPIQIAAGTTYVASYFAPRGFYSLDEGFFNSTGVTSGPLTAPSSGSVGGNGVYAYGTSSRYPGFTFRGSNYWVDVVFEPQTGGNSVPVAGSDSASTNEDTPITINVLANDTDPDGDALQVTSLNLTGTLGSVAINPNGTISYDPRAAYQNLAAGQTATDVFSYNVSDGRGGTASASVAVQVAGRDDGTTNKIVAENAKPGNPQSEWGISGIGDASIEGFATDMSVNVGGTVRFKVNTKATDYRLDIYRLGYYGGNGARKVATVEPSRILPNGQAAPIVNTATGLVDAGNWLEAASWTMPTDAVSGVYFAKLVREDGVAGSNHIYFVVRDDNGSSDVLFQTADTTWQAYNRWGIERGGGSFYAGNPAGRAYKVSYNRPFGYAGHTVNRPVLDAEQPMIRWLERNGYNVSYLSGLDTDRLGAELREHKAFLSVGHDEYWSGQQRANVEAARDAGVNLAFFSGNEVYWKTRWENSIDGSNTPYRTLVSYKETWANAKIDSNPAWTGTWRDPRFSPPSDGGRPENQLTGTIFTVDSYRRDTIQVPSDAAKMRFWRNTSIANLSSGQTATLTPNVLGYEWDEGLDNGFRPAGAINMSSTTVDVAKYLVDHGNTVVPGTATHELTMYRAPSGARVFGAGTTRWPWGLDATHINESSTVDPRMQQATVNLLADMGAQPATLQSGMVLGTASTDEAAPRSSITSPAAGTSITAGSTVTITGTATDTGGVVGGVEVSVNGGATWNPAKGRGTWTYTWQPSSAGTVNILSRATDDSLNQEPLGSGRTVTVTESVGPWSIWSGTTVPSIVTVNDRNPAELGVKFQASRNGYVTGIRFYKGSQNTGTHTGSLWTTTGTKLASVTFSNETATGWQQANFASPVAVSAGTTYVASYFTPTGFYSANSDYFQSTGVGNGPIRALSSPEAGGNGVFAYGTTSRFPGSSYRSSNYWADVVFTDTLAA